MVTLRLPAALIALLERLCTLIDEDDTVMTLSVLVKPPDGPLVLHTAGEEYVRSRILTAEAGAYERLLEAADAAVTEVPGEVPGEVPEC
jgi:hypothetical protein